MTFQELSEIGKRSGYQDGEINDALPHVTTTYFGSRKLLPSRQETQSWVFYFPEEPEYRNFAAFDFVVAELNALTRSEGAAKAVIQRNVLVERAVAKGIPRHDIQVAITWQLMSDQLVEKEGMLRFMNPGVRGSPSEQLKAHPRSYQKPNRARAYPIVKDVVARRTDGRPLCAEPFDAFADELENSAIDSSGSGGRKPSRSCATSILIPRQYHLRSSPQRWLKARWRSLLSTLANLDISNRVITAGTREAGKSTIWWQAQHLVDLRPFSTCKPRSALKLSSARASAFMPGACCPSTQLDRPIFVLTRRATLKEQRNRWCGPSSTGFRETQHRHDFRSHHERWLRDE